VRRRGRSCKRCVAQTSLFPPPSALSTHEMASSTILFKINGSACRTPIPRRARRLAILLIRQDATPHTAWPRNPFYKEINSSGCSGGPPSTRHTLLIQASPGAERRDEGPPLSLAGLKHLSQKRVSQVRHQIHKELLYLDWTELTCRGNEQCLYQP
jgi:hypothetical protein